MLPPRIDLGAVDEAELLGGVRPQTPIEIGTCGWEGDPEVCDLETRSNSGVTYIKVTLFGGSAELEPVSPKGFANGRRIRARIQWPFLYVPPFGTQCMVLFPGGSMEAPGVALCIPLGGPVPNPRLLPNVKEGDFVIYGQSGQFFRLHANGAVSLVATDDATDTGRTIYLRVGKNGLESQSPWMRLTAGKLGFNGLHTPSSSRLTFGSFGGLPPPLDALGSNVTIRADSVCIDAAAVSIGATSGLVNETAVTALITLLGTLAAAIDAAAMTPGVNTAIVTAAAAALANIGKDA